MKKALEARQAGVSEAGTKILTDMIAEAASGGEAAVEAPVLDDKPAVGTPEEEEEKKTEMVAASAIAKLTGKSNLAASVEDVMRWRTSFLKSEEDAVKLAKERAALELGKRKENAVLLTKLGA